MDFIDFMNFIDFMDFMDFMDYLISFETPLNCSVPEYLSNSKSMDSQVVIIAPSCRIRSIAIRLSFAFREETQSSTTMGK